MSPQLSILHLSTYDQLGGAAKAAKSIVEVQIAVGIHAELLVLAKTGIDSFVKVPRWDDPKVSLKLVHELSKTRRLHQKTVSMELHSFGEASAHIVDDINTCNADIVHLHWISNLLSIEDIGKITKPIVWTLHDMWPFSGSEHYPLSFNEDAFFFHPPKPDPKHSLGDNTSLSQQTWLKKNKYWNTSNFTIVSPSNWLANISRKSYLFNTCSTHVIHHPIQSENWQSQSKKAAKADFIFSNDKTVLLFIAHNPTIDLNKGWDILNSAIGNLDNRNHANIELVIVGSAEQKAISEQFPFPLHWIENINNNMLLSKLYSAADALLVPSRAEAFSLVTAEAQLCGLPVIGFDVGIIPDIIIDKKTGWVAEANSSSSLADGIKWILSNKENAQQAALKNRKQIVDILSPQKIGEQYLNLYQEILNGL